MHQPQMQPQQNLTHSQASQQHHQLAASSLQTPTLLADDEIIGAIKIKDGLFIGDEFAAQDLEFVVANKVTHIVNCAGKEISNQWEPIGVQFMWLDQENQLIFSNQSNMLGMKSEDDRLFEFIENAINKAESVLVHSVRGQSRASCAIAAYLMRKYKWALLKTLEFLNARRPELEIRATFIHQLSAYEARLHQKASSNKREYTSTWTELSEENCFLESDELLLRNTFLNAQMGPIAQLHLHGMPAQRTKLKWIDELTQGKVPLGSEGDPNVDICVKLIKNMHIPVVKVHRQINPQSLKTSIKVPVDSQQIMKAYPSIYHREKEHLGSHSVKQNNFHRIFYHEDSSVSDEVPSSSTPDHQPAQLIHKQSIQKRPMMNNASAVASKPVEQPRPPISSAEMMRKALDDHKIVNTQEGNVSQPQQPPIVTNIINNNNINNYFISPPQASVPIEQAMPFYIQNTQPKPEQPPQVRYQSPQQQLTQMPNRITFSQAQQQQQKLSTQIGNFNPSQLNVKLINQQTPPPPTRTIALPLQSSSQQAPITQLQQIKLRPQTAEAKEEKKKRQDSPKTVITNIQQDRLYQQLQSQLKNKISTAGPTMALGSARMHQGVPTTAVVNSSQKLNSFRGGPIKATVNMNTEQQLPTQSENISRQPQMQQQKSAKVPQRPSSSKPILKNGGNEGETGPIIISKVQRPSSPGVAANKIVKASIVSNSGSKPTKVRLRSASPQQQNQQQQQPLQKLTFNFDLITKILPLQIQQTYQQPAPASTQFKMSAVNQRIPTTTTAPGNKQQPPQMQYMRGYSPSKPKWKM